MTDGTNYAGFTTGGANGNNFIIPILEYYNTAVGTRPPFKGQFSNNLSVGITPDPTKSGIVANLSDIDIGEVNSMKLGKYILKY